MTETPLEFADRVFRYASRFPCVLPKRGIPTYDGCECPGCAGRKYVALADAAVVASRRDPVLAVDRSWSTPDAAAPAVAAAPPLTGTPNE